MSNQEPAAFGRLCVETTYPEESDHTMLPAAFGRLCVETRFRAIPTSNACQPPSGGCVLKQVAVIEDGVFVLPAAFGRLCVETLLVGLQMV